MELRSIWIFIIVLSAVIEIIISKSFTCQSKTYYYAKTPYNNKLSITCSNISSFLTIVEYIDQEDFWRGGIPTSLRLLNSTISSLPEGSLSSNTKWELLHLTQIHTKNISASAFQGMEKLEELYLDKNELTELPKGVFSGLHNMKKLFLQYNKISRIDGDLFKDLENLQELRLDNNELKLTKDVFYGLHNLKKLSLSSNNMEKMDRSVFKNLEKLTDLNVSHNSLEIFEIGAFSSLRSLQILDISSNKLVELNSRYNFVLFSELLEELYFGNNPKLFVSLSDLLEDFPRLKLISFNNIEKTWACEELKEVFKKFKLKNVVILKGESFDEDNIGGIACHK